MILITMPSLEPSRFDAALAAFDVLQRAWKHQLQCEGSLETQLILAEASNAALAEMHSAYDETAMRGGL